VHTVTAPGRTLDFVEARHAEGLPAQGAGVAMVVEVFPLERDVVSGKRLAALPACWARSLATVLAQRVSIFNDEISLQLRVALMAGETMRVPVLAEGTYLGLADRLVALSTRAPVHALQVPFLALGRVQVLAGDAPSTLAARVRSLNTVGAFGLAILHVEGSAPKLLVALGTSEVVHVPHLVHSFDVLASEIASALATPI